MQPPALCDDLSGEPPTDDQRLILVGASVRAAAQSAQRAGISVSGIDLFGDTDTREACDTFFRVDSMNELIGQLSQLPTAPLMHVGGFENDLALLRRLARTHPLYGPDPRVAQSLSQPATLASLAHRSGLHYPETIRLAGEHAESTRTIGSPSGADPDLPPGRFPVGPGGRTGWLIKRPALSGGLGVRWAGAAEVAPLARSAAATDGYFQRWIAGRVYGASYLSDGNAGVLLGVCRSRFTRWRNRPFVYRGSDGPLSLPGSLTDSLRRLGHLIAGTGVRGLFGVDLVIDDQGLGWLLEINPRWTGSSELIERDLRASGLLADSGSLVGAAIDAWRGSMTIAANDAAVGGNARPNESRLPNDSEILVKRIVYANQRTTFVRQKVDLAMARVRDSPITAELLDVPADGSCVEPGEPVLTLLATLPSHRLAGGQTARLLRRTIDAIRTS